MPSGGEMLHRGNGSRSLRLRRAKRFTQSVNPIPMTQKLAIPMVVLAFAFTGCLGGASLELSQRADKMSGVRGCNATIHVDSRIGIGNRLKDLTKFGCLPTDSLDSGPAALTTPKITYEVVPNP